MSPHSADLPAEDTEDTLEKAFRTMVEWGESPRDMRARAAQLRSQAVGLPMMPASRQACLDRGQSVTADCAAGAIRSVARQARRLG